MHPQDEWFLSFLKDLKIGFEALERTLSIVVQGPLHPRMKESLPYYLKAVNEFKRKRSGNLVVSCWENDDMSIIKNMPIASELELVVNEGITDEERKGNAGSRGASPWILQNHTTEQGLRRATGRYSIKVRSDEIHKNISLFHKKLLAEESGEGKGKVITSDIYFRADSVEKFHPSDHIIAGKTKHLKKAFKIAVATCKSPDAKKFRFPEQLICYSLLKAKGVEPKEYKSQKIMKENFDIIPLRSMSGSIWTCSKKKYKALTAKETGWCSDIDKV
jgi:hypothetical protein